MDYRIIAEAEADPLSVIQDHFAMVRCLLEQLEQVAKDLIAGAAIDQDSFAAMTRISGSVSQAMLDFTAVIAIKAAREGAILRPGDRR